MFPAVLIFVFTDTAMMWDIRSYARSQVMWPGMGLYVGVIFFLLHRRVFLSHPRKNKNFIDVTTFLRRR